MRLVCIQGVLFLLRQDHRIGQLSSAFPKEVTSTITISFIHILGTVTPPFAATSNDGFTNLPLISGIWVSTVIKPKLRESGKANPNVTLVHAAKPYRGAGVWLQSFLTSPLGSDWSTTLLGHFAR